MAAAKRNLEEELDTLQAGLDMLRKDIRSLSSAPSEIPPPTKSRRGGDVLAPRWGV
jgi:hypothetical protein